ncbi:MAG: wax ester/triacylglycerol synthase family O-acyltransferase [Solirubrobacterales bacterium]|nr:wax ester/triacylglycerol synthase family O-acyltransferase [Solirubrobacterales bacterium]
MRQLTSLDAQVLALETPRQSGHVGGVAILDPSTRESGVLTGAHVQELIAERLPLLPPLRWRLHEVPLGLDYPYWVDDPHFDLDFHVRELALPSPGSDEQLAEQVARIVARPLDRARPLWELYLISGLESGHVALLSKIHHALVDGMSGAEIMGLLLDLSPEGRELPPPRRWADDEAVPGQLGMLARGLLGLPRYPVRAARALPSAVPNIMDTPFATLPGARAVGRVAKGIERRLTGQEGVVHARGYLPAPKTSFNGRVCAHRRFVFGQLPLDEVKAVKNAHGCTVNDVVVTLCASAVRRWLLEHGELPDGPLVAQIPVSVRTQKQIGTFGNRIMLMSAPLYTDEADPVTRLRRTHDALAGMKERHRALPAGLMQDANDFIPPAVFSRAAKLTFRLATSRPGRPTWNLVISNVPGPPIPLYLAGAQLVANYPVSVITDGMGLNITVMSYCGHLDVGIVADREQMPDASRLMGWLREALDELLAAGQAGTINDSTLPAGSVNQAIKGPPPRKTPRSSIASAIGEPG